MAGRKSSMATKMRSKINGWKRVVFGRWRGAGGMGAWAVVEERIRIVEDVRGMKNGLEMQGNREGPLLECRGRCCRAMTWAVTSPGVHVYGTMQSVWLRMAAYGSARLHVLHMLCCSGQRRIKGTLCEGTAVLPSRAAFDQHR